MAKKFKFNVEDSNDKTDDKSDVDDLEMKLVPWRGSNEQGIHGGGVQSLVIILITTRAS